jgi:hypothetical protein
LAACLGAWAADQVPAAAASAQGDVTAGPRYKVAFTAVNQLNGRTRVSMQMDMPVPAGKRMQLVSLRQPPPKGLNCDIAMEVQASGAGQVSIQLPFSCDGGKPTHPRLITGLGQRATIQTGSKVDGERLYTFTVTVTPWPEGTPWPQGRAASASGTP